MDSITLLDMLQYSNSGLLVLLLVNQVKVVTCMKQLKTNCPVFDNKNPCPKGGVSHGETQTEVK